MNAKAGRLAGKTAFITAAAQGIGRATAEAFAAEGAKVWATDIAADKLTGFAHPAAIQARRLDVTDDAAVAAVAQEVGAIDILFNCAGWVPAGTLLDTGKADWMRAFDINVHSMYRTIRAFLPGMLAQGHGVIINTASVVSSLKGVPNRAAYGATKAAVIGLTKAVAADYVTKGIRCNALCPGTVETPSLHDRLQAFADPAAARRDFIARQPMGRLGTPEEIAALCVYLASDESAFVTGTVQVIDGGMTI
ncbi:MAG TPA: SDR family oxidoreductase [Hypericibacter adhaerens]|jgi:2-keto-3-deoxy-L-fuconate dehydrogenase|uniref:NAD(P)-dependent oxidoreductase n=1 Tax=Hypericibacter adhaerens TaxID=2602016 RepID=A0A5J6N404_9PROT|nr:SDR family oxidoreductase [Hypericibacter adhaerens]QEX24571.1 NAD(P)-dependent oxidoreductase [Hypericibacter adhaerens]HWA45782.1 SDR family oxidoreductase [Hypericibacter adhaerens]